MMRADRKGWYSRSDDVFLPPRHGVRYQRSSLTLFENQLPEIRDTGSEGVLRQGLARVWSKRFGHRKRPNESVRIREDLHLPSIQSSASESVIGCHHSSPADTRGSLRATPNGKPFFRTGTSSATGWP